MATRNKRNFRGMELNSVASTQSLGLYSTRGGLSFRKGRKRVEICLLTLCGVLLLICVVLAALFAVEISKRSAEDNIGRATSPPLRSTSQSPTSKTPAPRVCNTAECLEIAARFARNINESVDPCEDFFHFACDGWIRDNPIPSSENEYITFMKKIRANDEKLRNLLEDASGDFDDPVMKAKRFYRSCMAEDEAEKTSTQQMVKLIRNLGSWAVNNASWNESSWDWRDALLIIQRIFSDSSPLFAVEVLANPKDSTKHIVKVVLPELSFYRDQYLKNSTEAAQDKAITEEKGTEEPHAEEKGNDYARQIVERKTFNKHRLASLNEVFVSEDASRSSQLLHKEYNLSEILNRPFRDSETKKELYIKYMTKVGMLLEGRNQSAHMRRILAFEEKLAQIMPSQTIIYENSHKTMTIQQLEQHAPDFQWRSHLNSLFADYNITLNSSENIIVPAPDYLRNMPDVLHASDNVTLSNYFIWTVVRGLVPFLSRPFREAEAEYKRVASHIRAEPARWLTCIKSSNYYRGLGFATGSLYVEKAFDQKMIPLVKEMMDSIRNAFREEVANLTWIDDETKPKVYEKENAMVEKIGYPEMCVNKTLLRKYYSGLEVDDKRFLLNMVNVSKWYTSHSLAKLRNPQTRGQWYNGPQSVNAYYQRERNEINVLAGILQPPYYHGRLSPRAVNFGGIGIVLAHELTHGFDNKGRLFNMYGEISDPWWSNFTVAGFHNRSQCLVEQYNKYPVGEDNNGQPLFVNGRLTLGENIADNGALKIAIRAYENWVKAHGPEPLLPALKKSSEQMFFLSYGQMWCSLFSPSQITRRVMADTHALPIYRVNGVLSNVEEFTKAYNCPKGSKLNPIHRCRVW